MKFAYQIKQKLSRTRQQGAVSLMAPTGAQYFQIRLSVRENRFFSCVIVGCHRDWTEFVRLLVHYAM
jgi:hypothetical protein